jgi:phosphatidylserine/phosphatidylglycerophosphate/cardiolipin synthase-like enzyme
VADALELLAVSISPSQAVKIASSLEIDGSLPKALTKLPEDSPARTHLSACFLRLGAEALASVLRALAAAGSRSSTSIRAVWSGPTFDGDGDHTTSALSHVIDEATEDVFASTYSATAGSAFVEALWRAIARGVRTTLLVDSTVNHGATLSMLKSKLEGATFWTFVPADGGYGLQHAKVVIVDSRLALVTSANLSDAAAERNLEAGVIVRDTDFASKMRRRFSALRSAGRLMEV